LKISVIIVSYNCKAFLDYCLQSVIKALKQIDSEILVIDNCSTDGSVEYLKSKKYDLRIIENKENLGFSKANNKAAKLAKGEYLFFLNPDTIIPEDLIDSFFKNKKPNTGIFSFRMIDGEGIFLKESKRNFPNISIISKKLIGINSGYYSDLGEFDSGNVDVLCGANMLI
jgi:GT2 family glycosyltransferase